MCLIKQRANNPEQKALRRRQILLATRQRFQSASYEEVNLNQIAADVGMTKAALYRYFRNKETLFLALFVESLEELIQYSEENTRQLSLADTICEALISQPLYCKLSAILHTVLERNLTSEEAYDFKHMLLSLMQKFAGQLASHPEAPVQQAEQAVILLMQIQESLIGVWHMTHPTGAVAEVVQQPGLTVFRRTFEDSIRCHIKRLLTRAE
jgi:AcrR family transcriptional regulator